MREEKRDIFDLVVIGSGPAGLTASIYASRYKMTNLVLGKQKGGTIGLAHKVENYPGFVSISGLKLMEEIEKQVKELGAKIIYDPAAGIKKEGGLFKVYTAGKKEFQARTLILATGTERRKLGIPGEEEFLGRGVTYCHTCDAPFFQDKIVAVIGGADAAVSGAIHTAEYAKRVYIIYRKDKLRAEPIWVEQALSNPKISPIFNTNVVRILGYKDIRILGEREKKFLSPPAGGSQYPNINIDRVAAVELDNAYGESKFLGLDGVFIEIGGVPGTALAKIAGVKVNEAGYVEVDREMKTNVAGLFAAGDMTNFWPHFQQVVTVQAMGAIAAASAYQFLKQEQAPPQRGI